MRQKQFKGQTNVAMVTAVIVVSAMLAVFSAMMVVCYVRHRRLEDNLRTYANRHYNIRSETVTESLSKFSKIQYRNLAFSKTKTQSLVFASILNAVS